MRSNSIIIQSQVFLYKFLQLLRLLFHDFVHVRSGEASWKLNPDILLLLTLLSSNNPISLSSTFENSWEWQSFCYGKLQYFVWKKAFQACLVFLSVLETEVEGSLSVSELTDSYFSCLENLWIGRRLTLSVETLQLRVCLLITPYWVWSSQVLKTSTYLMLWLKLSNWVALICWIHKRFQISIFSNIGTTISSRAKCAF